MRQQWAADNEEMILLCGRNFKDPKAFDFWRKLMTRFSSSLLAVNGLMPARRTRGARRTTADFPLLSTLRSQGFRFTPQWAGTLRMASV